MSTNLWLYVPEIYACSKWGSIRAAAVWRVLVVSWDSKTRGTRATATTVMTQISRVDTLCPNAGIIRLQGCKYPLVFVHSPITHTSPCWQCYGRSISISWIAIKSRLKWSLCEGRAATTCYIISHESDPNKPMNATVFLWKIEVAADNICTRTILTNQPTNQPNHPTNASLTTFALQFCKCHKCNHDYNKDIILRCP